MQTKIKKITLNKKSKFYENYIQYEMEFDTFEISHIQLGYVKPSGYERYYHSFMFHIKDFFDKYYGDHKNSSFLNFKHLFKGFKRDFSGLWKGIKYNTFKSPTKRYYYEFVGIINGELYKNQLHTMSMDTIEVHSAEMEDLFLYKMEDK